MRRLNQVLIAAAMLSIASTMTLADEAQTVPQPQTPSDSATMSDCPGMSGMMGMGTKMGDGRHGMTGMGMGMMRPGMMVGTPAMVEDRLAAIKTELKITDAQTDPWAAYASAIKDQATVMQSMHESMTQAMQSGTAVSRLDAHIKHMTAMLDAMKALKPATENLYRVLNEEQKKKADTVLGAGCGMM
jgi:hypothetical protein